MKTWTTQDKTDWLPGPWDDEPDKAQWVSEAGLPALITRNHIGVFCGYAGVFREHPWYGVDYDVIVANALKDLDVHGGLTFSGSRDEGLLEPVWWFGFDCGGYDDLQPALPFSFPSDVYRNFAYVLAEVERLAMQLEECATSSER